MEITILEEERNPMLHRTDVTFRVSHVEATPDRLAVRDSLAARLNKDADEVVIRKLDTKFGMRTTIGEAKVYEGPEHTREVEHEYMLARNKIGDHGVEPEPAEGAEADAEEVEADAEAAEADTEEVEAEPAEEVEADAEEAE